ncbi:MAG: CPBP family glutamic-type intramembrane protease, partial [Turicibacter sp.]
LVLSSLLFGFIHVISAGDFIQAIPYVMMGFAVGYVYPKNQNIWYSIGVHFIQNLFSTVILLLSIFFL